MVWYLKIIILFTYYICLNGINIKKFIIHFVYITLLYDVKSKRDN